MNTETELWMEKAEEAWDKKDYKMAAKWYKKAAEAGDAGGQYCLGMCYYGGLGVKLNEGAAFKWVRKAAEQNEPDAQKALGDMYLRGEGVKADEIEALEWYRKASYNGNGEAGRIVDQMIHALELMI
jgi:hypothetical protein